MLKGDWLQPCIRVGSTLPSLLTKPTKTHTVVAVKCEMVQPKPLALYVHVPFCNRKCPYCGFYSEPMGAYDIGRVLAALVTELDRYDLQRPARTVYVGGGSPSCLPQGRLLRLLEQITQRVGVGSEFTVEVNPGQIDEHLLERLCGLGVNRLSVGGQSFEDCELEFLARGYKGHKIVEVVHQARRAGFDNINLDLIFAIPGSTLQSWQRNLAAAMELGVEHISAYSLTYEKGTLLYKRRQANQIDVTDEETDRAMYELAIDQLIAAGFEHYEISNFARKADGRSFECRHNLVYWANEAYIGIGPGASSYWQGRRTSNVADVGVYVEAIEQGKDVSGECETPDEPDRACQTAVLMLRRIKGIDLEEYRQRTGFDVLKMFAEPIWRYQKLGFLVVEHGRLHLTREALPIADSILCDFAAV